MVSFIFKPDTDSYSPYGVMEGTGEILWEKIWILDNFFLVRNVKTKEITFNYGHKEVSKDFALKAVKMLNEGNGFKHLITVEMEVINGNFVESAPTDRKPYTNLIRAFSGIGFTEKDYNMLRRLTYEELFSIDDDSLRIKLFFGLNIEEMINHCVSERISVDGKKVKRWVLDSGKEVEIEYDSVYELYKVRSSDFLANARVEVWDYCLKVWCTSTNKEHWIWVVPDIIPNGLEAVASTCRIQEDIIDDVIHLVRQGDQFGAVFKPDFDFSRIDINKPKRSLTAEEYFRLMRSES